MANRGEHQRGYQREPQRAEADPAVLGQVGSRFDNPWSHGGPTYMSAPLLNAAHQYIGPTFVEQSLEQIVDGFDHHAVPPLRFRNGTPGSPPRTIDPQRLLRQRQVPSLQGHDMVGAQHSRALPNASIATAQSTLQARARASEAGRAPQQQRGGADFQTAAWPSYPVDANVAAIRGQYQQTQSIDSTVATASAILEGARTVRSFICDVCGRKCKDQQALRHHLSNVHDPTKKYKFKCPNCEMRFPYQHSLGHHVNSKHRERDDKIMHPCPDCGREFARLYNMQRHHSLAHPDSLNSVRTAKPSAKTPRRQGTYIQQPLGLVIPMRRPSPPATAFSMRRNEDLYSQVARLGYHAGSMTRTASQASAPSTIWSDPGTPFTRPTFDTTPTEVDESWLDPTLRSKRGTPSARSSMPSQW